MNSASDSNFTGASVIAPVKRYIRIYKYRVILRQGIRKWRFLAKLILYCMRNEYDRMFSINLKNHLTVFMRSYIVSLGAVQGTIQWHLLLLG